MTVLKIGTRDSRLAIARAERVAQGLREVGQEVELVHVASPPATDSGDRYGPLPYVQALHTALSEGTVDVAVQSYKDLPLENPPRLTTAAIVRREDARDVLVSRGERALHDLPEGSRVGVSALRRRGQLAALGLEVELVSLPGNVDDFEGRIAQVREGRVEAVVLAQSGMAWLGLTDQISQHLDPLVMLPAAAQGAIACQCRANDLDTEHLLRTALHNENTAVAVEAERAAMFRFMDDPVDCAMAPFGALASVDTAITLRGVAQDSNGRLVRATVSGAKTEPRAVGHLLAEKLVSRGARRSTKEFRTLTDSEQVALAIDEGYESWLG